MVTQGCQLTAHYRCQMFAHGDHSKHAPSGDNLRIEHAIDIMPVVPVVLLTGGSHHHTFLIKMPRQDLVLLGV